MNFARLAESRIEQAIEAGELKNLPGEGIPLPKDDTGGDGLTIDTQGNLYITSGLGIQVYNRDGKLLGILSFPEQPANCSFGGPDNQTLFVTARTSLYAVEMGATGHVFPGKAE